MEPPALPAKTSPAAGSGKQTAGGKNDHGSPVTREAIAEQLDAMDVTPPARAKSERLTPPIRKKKKTLTACAPVLPWIGEVHSPAHPLSELRPDLASHRPPTWVLDQEMERLKLQKEYEGAGSRPMSFAANNNDPRHSLAAETNKTQAGQAAPSEIMSRGAAAPGAGGLPDMTGPTNSADAQAIPPVPLPRPLSQPPNAQFAWGQQQTIPSAPHAQQIRPLGHPLNSQPGNIPQAQSEPFAFGQVPPGFGQPMPPAQARQAAPAAHFDPALHPGYSGTWPTGLPYPGFPGLPLPFQPGLQGQPAPQGPSMNEHEQAQAARPATASRTEYKTAAHASPTANVAKSPASAAARPPPTADDEITQLQERMKRNAEESRAALAKERDEREAERKKALDILAALESADHVAQDSHEPISPKSPNNDSNAYKTTFLHTDMGDIKTYEKVRHVSPEGDDGATPLPNKRETGQTQTSTSGPSFGHFGRPFSHQLGPTGGNPISTIPEVEEDVPVFVMHMSGEAPFTAPLGLGLGLGGLFGPMTRDPDKRSAYVETIPDEETQRQTPGNTHPYPPETPRHEPKTSNTFGSSVGRAVSGKFEDAPDGSGLSVRGSDIASLGGKPTPATASLIDQMVKDTLFHDDTLCQLLLASREESIGEPARHALRQAAKERIIELSKAERSARSSAPSPASVRKGVPSATAASSTALDEVGPAWSRALFAMLEAANARLEDLDHRLNASLQARRPRTETILSRDEVVDEAAARAALHNLLFPNHPVEIHGVSNEVKGSGVSHNRPQTPGPPKIHVQPPSAEHSRLGKLSGPASTAAAQSLQAEPQQNTSGTAAPTHATHQPNLELSNAQWQHNQHFPKPWDVVAQRLYSWALVWMQDDFVRALEHVALGHQVDEFALTIYMMMIFKRNLRHRLCSVPPLPCDKLFVPPNMADALNRAVHAKRFGDAQQILQELWWPFGFQTPPRVIVALAKHRNDSDHWAAHRFDLPSGRLVTMSFSSEEKSLIDGRPFMWWHAIRAAWPEHQIPHPDHLAMKTQRTIFPSSTKGDNSLAATNAARNFLLGWRPDRPTDLRKMREMVWQEIKRLYGRKVAGKLIIDPEEEVVA